MSPRSTAACRSTGSCWRRWDGWAPSSSEASEARRSAADASPYDRYTIGLHHQAFEAPTRAAVDQAANWLRGVALVLRAARSARYLYAPYRVTEMHWFCKPHPSRRTHHLHLVPSDSCRFRDELVFRDYLRARPDVAEEYRVLKRRLAAQFEEDREAYTAAKTMFIRATGDRSLRAPGPD